MQKAGVAGSLDINTRVVHTTRFGVPASINFEFVFADPEQTAVAEKTLLAEISRLGRENIDAAAVAFAQKTLRTNWYRTAADPNKLAFEIGHFEVMDSWKSLQPYLEARDATTPDTIRQLIGRYFVAKNRSVGVVTGPEQQP